MVRHSLQSRLKHHCEVFIQLSASLGILICMRYAHHQLAAEWRLYRNLLQRCKREKHMQRRCVDSIKHSYCQAGGF